MKTFEELTRLAKAHADLRKTGHDAADALAELTQALETTQLTPAQAIELANYL